MGDEALPGVQPAVGRGVAGLVFAVLAGLLLIFNASDWYAAQVSLSRFCQDREVVLQRLAAVLSESVPIGDDLRRDHMVAAKLVFLVPPIADESREDYVQRVRERLVAQCR